MADSTWVGKKRIFEMYLPFAKLLFLPRLDGTSIFLRDVQSPDGTTETRLLFRNDAAWSFYPELAYRQEELKYPFNRIPIKFISEQTSVYISTFSKDKPPTFFKREQNRHNILEFYGAIVSGRYFFVAQYLTKEPYPYQTKMIDEMMDVFESMNKKIGPCITPRASNSRAANSYNRDAEPTNIPIVNEPASNNPVEIVVVPNQNDPTGGARRRRHTNKAKRRS